MASLLATLSVFSVQTTRLSKATNVSTACLAASNAQTKTLVSSVRLMQYSQAHCSASAIVATSWTRRLAFAHSVVRPVQRAQQPISVTLAHLASSLERPYACSVLQTSTSKVTLALFVEITALSAPQVPTSALLAKHHTRSKTMENASFVLTESISTPPQELVSHALPYATLVSHLMSVSRAQMARS